jgi:hypothetical protein
VSGSTANRISVKVIEAFPNYDRAQYFDELSSIQASSISANPIFHITCLSFFFGFLMSASSPHIILFDSIKKSLIANGARVLHTTTRD